MQDRVYDPNYKSVALTQFSGRLKVGESMDEFRNISVKECERLQGLPDGYTSCVSKSAAYSLIGNGWEVNTVVEFFKHLPEEYKKW